MKQFLAGLTVGVVIMFLGQLLVNFIQNHEYKIALAKTSGYAEASINVFRAVEKHFGTIATPKKYEVLFQYKDGTIAVVEVEGVKTVRVLR